MNRTFTPLASALLLASTLGSCRAAAGEAPNKPPEADKAPAPSLFDTWEDKAMGIGDWMTYEATGKAADELRQGSVDIVKALDEKIPDVYMAMQRGGDKTLGNALINEAQEIKKAEAAKGGFWGNVGKFLQLLDFVSTGAKVAGHMIEGDREGADAVVLDDLCKKATVALTCLAGSKLPVIGNIGGAILGEEIHKATTGKYIEEITDRARNQRYRDEMLVSHIPPTYVIDRWGTRLLPPDMYVEKGTGLIKRYTPKQMQDLESKYRKEANEARESQHPLAKASRDLDAGRITMDEFRTIVSDYNDPKKRAAMLAAWQAKQDEDEAKQNPSNAVDTKTQPPDTPQTASADPKPDAPKAPPKAAPVNPPPPANLKQPPRPVQNCPRCGVRTTTINTPLCNGCTSKVALDYAMQKAAEKNNQKRKPRERDYWQYLPASARK